MRQKKAKPINRLARLIYAKNPEEQSCTQVRKELKETFRYSPIAEIKEMIRQHYLLQEQKQA